MQARILCIPDLHKRDKDSASIHGQRAAAKKVQQDLLNIVAQHQIDKIILLGDWYHKGFHNMAHFWEALQEDKQLSDSVNGEVYDTVGNHFYLERDTNPEMYCVQPNNIPALQPTEILQAVPERPIFKVVPQLQIGGVQIDFFHFSKVSKNYHADLNPETVYHIGIYHDDTVVPGWVRQQEGYLSGSVSQQHLNSVYDNINLGIIGHVHTTVGVVKQELLNGRTVPLIIPGALCITANTPAHKHEFVDLPILDINDDNTVTLKQLRQSLHTECMVFLEKKTKVDQNPLVAAEAEVMFKPTSTSNVTEYLREKGYNNVGLRLVNEACKMPLTITDVIDIINEEVATSVEYTGALPEETDCIY